MLKKSIIKFKTMELDEGNDFGDSIGTWNSTGGRIPLENMKIDAPMVNINESSLAFTNIFSFICVLSKHFMKANQ